jgi:hypothetical protein
MNWCSVNNLNGQFVMLPSQKALQLVILPKPLKSSIAIPFCHYFIFEGSPCITHRFSCSTISLLTTLSTSTLQWGNSDCSPYIRLLCVFTSPSRYRLWKPLLRGIELSFWRGTPLLNSVVLRVRIYTLHDEYSEPFAKSIILSCISVYLFRHLKIINKLTSCCSACSLTSL